MGREERLFQFVDELIELRGPEDWARFSCSARYILGMVLIKAEAETLQGRRMIVIPPAEAGFCLAERRHECGNWHSFSALVKADGQRYISVQDDKEDGQ